MQNTIRWKGYGILETDISRVVGIDAKTLRKHYRKELDLGETKANAQVAGFVQFGQDRQCDGADILAQDPGALAGIADRVEGTQEQSAATT